MKGLHISFVNMIANCQECNHEIDTEPFYERIVNTKQGFITRKCPNCKARLGLCYGFTGNAIAFLRKQRKEAS